VSGFGEVTVLKADMTAEALIILIVCVGLLAYLVYAMLRPEKF